MAGKVIGEVVGNHRIIEPIGDGGMGTIYLARHVLTDLPAAVKVLHRHHLDDEDSRRRFFNEAQAAMRIRHPGIVRVYDCGTHDDGSAYLVMEYLEGQDLAKRIRGGRRLAVATSVVIGRQVVEALIAAHDHGVIHRDLKPDNLFMTPDADAPGSERVKVLDFGIAKLVHPDHNTLHKTQTGTLMGTPTYMSPEQCRGAGDVDHRTDLYSLGCILFRLMCGRIVFRGQGYGELIAAHIHLPPPQPRSIEPGIPLPLEAIILKLLAKRPEDRYQSALDLIAALDDAVAESHLGLPEVVDLPDTGDEDTGKRRPTTRDDTQVFSSKNRPQESLIDTLGTERRKRPSSASARPSPRRLSPAPARPASAASLQSSRTPVPDPAIQANLRDSGRSGPLQGSPDAAKKSKPTAAARDELARARSREEARDHAFTTLRSATGDAGETEPQRPVRWFWAVFGLVLLAVGGAAFVLLYFDYTVRIDDPFAGHGPKSASQADAVTVRIESTPPGAEVTGPGGILLGKTPYETTMPRARGEWVVRLDMPGYEPVTVTVPLSRSSTKSVSLAQRVVEPGDDTEPTTDLHDGGAPAAR